MVYERGESPGGGSPLCSSPLARGTCSQSEDDPRNPGFIPAHAGNTTGNLECRRVDWAHPRSRGEHSMSNERRWRQQGSSPLARGTLISQVILGLAQGLIPARAGNIAVASIVAPPRGAHPRSRGEHATRKPALWFVLGSSPLTRGTLRTGIDDHTKGRLIPAHAGNTATIL